MLHPSQKVLLFMHQVKLGVKLGMTFLERVGIGKSLHMVWKNDREGLQRTQALGSGLLMVCRPALGGKTIPPITVKEGSSVTCHLNAKLLMLNLGC